MDREAAVELPGTPNPGPAVLYSGALAERHRSLIEDISHATEMMRSHPTHLNAKSRTKYLDYIADRSRVLSRLVDNLSWYERLRTGTIHPVPAAYSGTELVDDALKLIPEFDFSRRLKIEHGGEAASVRLDRFLPAFALSKVLRNAWVYSPSDSPISLSVLTRLDGVEVRVRDHGRGIPAVDLAHLSEPLYRGSNVGRTPGCGMGLALARVCLVVLKGQLRIETMRDEGTLVQITYPCSNE